MFINICLINKMALFGQIIIINIKYTLQTINQTFNIQQVNNTLNQISLSCFDSSCLSCLNNKCTECSAGYNLNAGGVCQQISFDEYCIKCINEAEKTCLTCSKGITKYYLINGECYAEGTLGFIIFFCVVMIVIIIIIVVCGVKKGWFKCLIQEENEPETTNISNNNQNRHQNENYDFYISQERKKEILIENFIKKQHTKLSNQNNETINKEVKSLNNNIEVIQIMPKLEMPKITESNGEINTFRIEPSKKLSIIDEILLDPTESQFYTSSKDNNLLYAHHLIQIIYV